MNKWKNYGLWVAVFGFIPILAEALGTYDINLVLPGNYDKLVIAILGILVLAGIISNPESGKGFIDKK